MVSGRPGWARRCCCARTRWSAATRPARPRPPPQLGAIMTALNAPPVHRCRIRRSAGQPGPDRSRRQRAGHEPLRQRRGCCDDPRPVGPAVVAGPVGAGPGAITLLVAVILAAILAVAALVADGGARIRTAERADIVAGEAALAASYASEPDDTNRTSAAKPTPASRLHSGQPMPTHPPRPYLPGLQPPPRAPSRPRPRRPPRSPWRRGTPSPRSQQPQDVGPNRESAGIWSDGHQPDNQTAAKEVSAGVPGTARGEPSRLGVR